MNRQRQVAIAQRIHRIQEASEARLARLLMLFFRDQSRRVVTRWTMRKAVPAVDLVIAGHWRPIENKATLVETLFPSDEFERLYLLITRLLTATVSQISDLAGEMVGLPPLPPTDPRLLMLLARAGHRITRITDETRAAVQDTLRTGSARGYSDYQVAHGVPRDAYRGIQAVVAETYRGRAATIARTETAVASQDAAHDRYHAAGVTEVDIIDGPGCGWTYHDDPDEADGSRRTLEQAAAHPISHPNCRRISLPVLESRD